MEKSILIALLIETYKEKYNISKLPECIEMLEEDIKLNVLKEALDKGITGETVLETIKQKHISK